ncbi:AAA family ATPase [Candidatus Thiosymbion oneisti]|uniref:AAA family ATPase n=1 Tax=Candidatus Thiosymbion oneisti TaxID=589554 RepID=UPI000B01A33D|nr:AAA family ATPase [Candidatus Thiosymbion oneisti]
MTTKTIRTLKITNYKSIDSLELKGLTPFSVFAGPNGSGKSNFFDALDFVSLFLDGGIEKALRTHGGFANIHSENRRAEHSRNFGFELECDLPETRPTDGEKLSRFHYSLTLHDFYQESPEIEEHMSGNGASFLTRKKGDNLVIGGKEVEPPVRFSSAYSALLLLRGTPLLELLQNMGLYRIDPIGAKAPDRSDSDPTKLDKKGHNLASVLGRLEQNEQIRELIMDWMELVVPGVEEVRTEQQRLDGKTALLFKEQETERHFPAHMMSDGTIYALSLLVAVLDLPQPYGLTLIEEPERGLHPAAIRELIDLIREQATPRNPIWLTTHSESVVRALGLEELILVDKVDGRTRMKRADSVGLTQADIAPLGLDKIWLSNLLGGGLPW